MTPSSPNETSTFPQFFPTESEPYDRNAIGFTSDVTAPPWRYLELAKRHEYTTDTTSESNVPRSLNMPSSVLGYVS